MEILTSGPMMGANPPIPGDASGRDTQHRGASFWGQGRYGQQVGTIYSKHHFIISVLLGGLLGLGLASSGLELTLMIGYATALGVGIDIDHFLIARLNSGDWAAIARCVDRPSRIFVDQESIFAEGEVTRIQRLLSHLVIGGLVVAVWLPWPDWAILSATVLYVHILTDAMADVFELYHEG